MENLIRQSRELSNNASTAHIRELREQIEWAWRLIGIKGARGVGKTTLLLQQMKLSDPDQHHSIYLPLDDLHFSTNKLRETVEALANQGITHFYLDEVHKYEGWSREVKNLYDLKPDLFIVFTGSSIIELSQQQVVQLVLESDLTSAEGGPVQKVSKIALLLQIIAESAPFIPNISKLAERSGIDRNTLLRYLHHLEHAQLTASLYKQGKGITALQKPEKIYLDNTNLAYAISPEQPNVGNLRETFFHNQARQNHLVQYAREGDFLIDNKVVIEVGGKNKKTSQVKHLPEYFVAADDIETGVGKQIPLWLFGFLY